MRFTTIVILLLLAACNSTEKAVDKTKVSDKKTAIADDMGGARAASPLPSAGGGAPALAAAAQAQPQTQAPSPAAPAAPKAVIVNAGTDAKARRYVMTAGSVEQRDITIQTQEEASEAPGKVRALGFALNVEFRVNSASATGNKLTATIKTIKAMGKGPEAAQMNAQLGAAAGIVFQFEVSPTGGLENLQPVISPSMQNNQGAVQAAMGVLQLASEAFDALFPPLPEAPVGDGGTWEVTMPSENGAPTKSLLTAQNWAAGTLTVSADAIMPKSKAKLQGGGEAMVEGHAKTSYRYVNKLGGVPNMVQGERSDNQTITLGPGKVVKVKRSSKVSITSAK